MLNLKNNFSFILESCIASDINVYTCATLVGVAVTKYDDVSAIIRSDSRFITPYVTPVCINFAIMDSSNSKTGASAQLRE